MDSLERFKSASELCDYVVDYLHNDKQSLSNCSLVNYEWRSRASYHFFYHLSISCPSRGPTAILDFAEFAQSLKPGMGMSNYVKDIKFWGGRIGDGFESTLRKNRTLSGEYKFWKTPISASLLKTILHPFLYLHSLSLGYCNIVEDDTWEALEPSQGRSLSTLAMTGTQSAYSPLPLIQLLSVFTSIESLDFSSYKCLFSTRDNHEQEETEPFMCSTVVNVRSLSLCDECSEKPHTLTTLSRILSLPHLMRFSIHCDVDIIPTLGKFLHSVGNSLQHLHLDVREMFVTFEDDPRQAPERILEGLSLSSCLSLRSLSVSTLIEDDDSDWVAELGSLANLFSQVSSPRLRQLEIGVEVSHTSTTMFNQLHGIDWSALRRSLDNLARAGLTNILIFREKFYGGVRRREKLQDDVWGVFAQHLTGVNASVQSPY